ncbi:insulinase family protein [Legionella taurinensis]|uniref:Insulinase family protein n=1 Tax=Legionella taurinensis TaxID=70611 RepID=A0A3A5L3I4_9GAMM|nr:pitrilysin family protein [Legionella taurinensis]MDX1838668.1 pitrilysin family protein [Legionella taurinensis]PUT38825.1 insulinase family protein [Legionella taurinensis]PUT40177.1 insulinase family protein [Legionella taurinensis]PUT42483.1 insulinase family protein [Legionella taurinensis]PUT45903.1 insulinase family protein [Legionella taurinensis]
MKRLFLIAFLFSCAAATEANTFKTKKWETSHGAKVVFYQAKEVPMLDINVAFAAGSAYDDRQFGLASLTASMLDQGSGRLDASQIAETIADTGAQYNYETSRDMAVFRLKTLTSEAALKQSVDAFSLIINKPAFRQEAFNRQKNQLLMTIAQMQESPDDVANMTFFKQLYKNHPYAHPVNGTTETVRMLNAWQVRNFYKRYYVGANAVIVLVGAIDEEKAHQITEQLTEFLPKGEHAAPIPKAESLAAAEKVDVVFPSSQTMLRLGQVGINHASPNYFPLMVGNYILGGGALVSRLATEVREKRGLTYGIYSQFVPMPGDGPFIISLATENNQANTALQVTRETLDGFLKMGPSEDELTAAKQYLAGNFPLSLASNNSIAGMLLRIAFYNLPDDYLDTYVARIEAVSVEDIKKAFDEALKPSQMLLVTVGKK